jgi:glycosyltransferase involved in cell wall biosynthesis
MISVIISIYNKEAVLERVIQALFNTSSELVTEYIFVLDGCTDNSEIIVKKMVEQIPYHKTYKILYANNVYETRANNIGLKQATQPYSCIIQDDMEILEKNWDKRMLAPFQAFDDIFAVTARTAVQLREDRQFINGVEGPVGHNCFQKNNNVSRDIFYVNQLINRGPLLLDSEKLKVLNYFDETLPGLMGSDDVDMCIKAITKYGWKCGCYWIQYNSPLDWGSTRTGVHSHFVGKTMELNLNEVCNRHREFLLNWDKNKLYEERFLKDNNPDGYTIMP